MAAETLDDINGCIAALADDLGAEVHFCQSNHEGELIDRIHQARSDGFSGVLFNPGAYTHTSIALRDAIAGIGLPTSKFIFPTFMPENPFVAVPISHPSLSARSAVLAPMAICWPCAGCWPG